MSCAIFHLSDLEDKLMQLFQCSYLFLSQIADQLKVSSVLRYLLKLAYVFRTGFVLIKHISNGSVTLLCLDKPFLIDQHYVCVFAIDRDGSCLG